MASKVTVFVLLATIGLEVGKGSSKNVVIDHADKIETLPQAPLAVDQPPLKSLLDHPALDLQHYRVKRRSRHRHRYDYTTEDPWTTDGSYESWTTTDDSRDYDHSTTDTTDDSRDYDYTTTDDYDRHYTTSDPESGSTDDYDHTTTDSSNSHSGENPPKNDSGKVCPWGDWHSWSKCDCRTGTRMRIRNPKYLPGKYCTGSGCNNGCKIEGCAGETKACKRNKCPIDCVYSKWSSWSECDGPCGDTIRRRYRRVRVPALYGGRKCRRFMEEERCMHHNPLCAPVDCAVSEWAQWGECEQVNQLSQCGECIYGMEYANQVGGVQVRERVIMTRGGGHCPHLQESQPCYLSCC